MLLYGAWDVVEGSLAGGMAPRGWGTGLGMNIGVHFGSGVHPRRRLYLMAIVK